MTISSLTPTACVMTLRRGQVRASARADHASVEELLNFGVVLRDLRDRGVADQIDAAVARPQAGKPAVHRQQGGDSGADGYAARSDMPADFGIGPAQPILEARPKIRCGACDADRRQMVDDTGRSDLSSVMSAHSVGYHPETGLWLDQIIVFIELTDTAFVAHAEALKGKGDSFNLPPSASQASSAAHLRGARSCHFATGSNIRVSKTKVWAVGASVPYRRIKPISKRLGTAEPGKRGEEEGVGAGACLRSYR